MSENNTTTVAIACQGGGSHSAFTAGVLQGILENLPSQFEIEALSGTSGGAMCAAIAWDGLRRGTPERAIDRLDSFWDDIAARAPWEQLTNSLNLWGRQLTDEFGTFTVSPYWNPLSAVAKDRLREILERHVRFDGSTRSAPPHLFVGAVNVESGSFEVFVDGEHGVTALLASAAVPTIFRAVEIDGAGHWDGLYSQNPPIRHFTTEVAADRKPDEIWIVRINQVVTNETPNSLSAIEDRRNELSWNLPLEQETYMIESINGLIAEGIITHERYKHIELREINIDMELGRQSNLDRDPEFLDTLMERGASSASEFWTSGDAA